jgi:hypothetical protein
MQAEVWGILSGHDKRGDEIVQPGRSIPPFIRSYLYKALTDRN